ncbi:type I-E CRISPR-associated protein Cse1/CasA [Nocardia nova]|uniref:type I-E CRISPR-associated protein Cse1/CasA n=1 Tax=Nocardia nova TaxID=37330 RepID=UPI00046D7CC3|nr:type I-E CRISPR-associated protein Cse1/CasA [Nocardia nova]
MPDSIRVPTPRWDPRTEACIAVLTSDGHATTLGLADVLHQADDLQAIFGTTPGEVVAVVEYLLGICYAAKVHPGTVREWRKWVSGRHSLDTAAQWLLAQPDDAWNIFDPHKPLGQNAMLAPFLDEHGSGPAQLVLEHAGDYNQFFDHHHLEHPTPLSPAEAFRAMLVQHVYGPGLRGRVSGDLLGPKLNNLATGRLATRMRVLALGETVGDTLRLNLQQYESDGPDYFNTTWTQRGRRDFAHKPSGRMPDGPADLHTVLGRSILLRPSRNEDGALCVDRVIVGAGELLVPLPAEFRQDAVLVPRAKGEFSPLRPDVNKALWREAHALYAAVAENKKGTDLYSRLAELSGFRVRLWAVGLAIENNKLLTWLADSFPWVSGREIELYHAARNGSRAAEYVGIALGRAAEIAQRSTYPGAGSDQKGTLSSRFDTRTEHFAAAAAPFHRLLEATADGTTAAEATDEFARTLVDTARRLLANRLRSLPSNSRGLRARAAAENKLHTELTHSKAPISVREAADDDRDQ